jgi:hypothetical protein
MPGSVVGNRRGKGERRRKEGERMKKKNRFSLKNYETLSVVEPTHSTQHTARHRARSHTSAHDNFKRQRLNEAFQRSDDSDNGAKCNAMQRDEIHRSP